MAQIGRTLLTEFVKMCEERNSESIQYYSRRAFGNLTLQGQGGDQQRFNEGASADWLEQDQLFEICQSIGVQDWQDIYSILDVENLFENFVVELNYNQIEYLSGEQTIKVSPVCSGVHIGSSNWIVEIKGDQRYALVNYISFEGEYRYPKQVDKSAMVGVDVMIMATTVLNQKQVVQNLAQSQ